MIARFIKRYWAELLAFGAIFTVLLVTLSPGLTWMNTDSDGAHYVYASKYLTTAHHMSAPLYLLIGRMFLWLPVGTEAWRMGLISALSSMASAVFIYLIVRNLLTNNPKARLYAIISALVFGGSALVISQSTIIETYTLATMCGVMAYYFALKHRWTWVSVSLGVGIAVHPFLAFIVWAVLFIAKKEMRNWRRYMITISFFMFYLYIPIVGMFGEAPQIWGNVEAEGFFGGTLGMAMMLTGGLSMWDMPKRLMDTILIVIVSFGAGIIPMAWYFIKQKTWRQSLLWLVLIPIIYFAINLSNQTYVYMIVAIAFGSIAVGLGLSKLNIRWAVATCVVAVGLMGFNAYYFDIGRNLDPEMSAVKFYEEELPKIPNGDIFMSGGWNWAIIYLYLAENDDRDIRVVSMDTLSEDRYLAELEQSGIKLNWSDSTEYITRQGEIALSIAELNNDVWIAKETKPEVYQYEIVPAKGNEDYIGRWIGETVEAEWRWEKPSNPYKFISGELEVAEWHHILQSRHNAFFVIALSIYAYAVVWVLMRMRKRREKR